MSIGQRTFSGCTSLTSLTLGTELTSQIVIPFGNNVFSPDTMTRKIDLILGTLVLPEPDLAANTWQTTNGQPTGTPYT